MRNTIISIIIFLILFFIGYWFLDTYNPIKNILEKENKVELKNNLNLNKYKSYEIISCDLGIYNINYAFIGDTRSIDKDDSSLLISFHNLSRNSIFSNGWKAKYIGGTTIKNTTFENLLKMVKEDCSQFQESGSIGSGENVPKWTYTKAESKEEMEEKKQKKLEREQEEERKLEEMLNNMTEQEREEYEKEQERLQNRTEEEILRDKGYSEQEIQDRLKIEWKS